MNIISLYELIIAFLDIPLDHLDDILECTLILKLGHKNGNAVGGVCKVVGVHVASHNRIAADVQHPQVKKARHNNSSAAARSVESSVLACESLARSIHGHHAYCLICEVSRVPDLVQFLHDNGLN